MERGKSQFHNLAINFLDVSTPPLIHRNCCDRTALNRFGSSAGDIISGQYLNCQPFICAR